MQKLIYQSYLACINNSVGSKSYRQFFVNDSWNIYDVMDEWDKSCAYFVSSILKLFNYSQEYHATIDATVKDMLESWWYKVNDSSNILLWSVIVWAENTESFWHKHIGFYVWDNKAISNSSKSWKIKKHSKNFGWKRNISATYSYNFKLR